MHVYLIGHPLCWPCCIQCDKLHGQEQGTIIAKHCASAHAEFLAHACTNLLMALIMHEFTYTASSPFLQGHTIPGPQENALQLRAANSQTNVP